MPDKDDSQDGQDLTAPKEFEVQKKHIDRIRKSVVNDGSKIGYHSHVVDKYIGKKMSVDYKAPSSPVKSRKPGFDPNATRSGPGGQDGIKGLIDMARKGQGNIGLGNKLKKKLSP